MKKYSLLLLIFIFNNCTKVDTHYFNLGPWTGISYSIYSNNILMYPKKGAIISCFFDTNKAITIKYAERNTRKWKYLLNKIPYRTLKQTKDKVTFSIQDNEELIKEIETKYYNRNYLDIMIKYEGNHKNNVIVKSPLNLVRPEYYIKSFKNDIKKFKYNSWWHKY